MINKLAQEVHQNAVDHGFYDGEKNTAEMLCLIHSEVSEALEADRKDLYATEGAWMIRRINRIEHNTMFSVQFKHDVKDTFEDELADIMIRVMDLAAYKKIDLESHIKAKMRYNSLREHKHGKKY